MLKSGWDINVVSMLIPFCIFLLLPVAVRSSRLLMLYWIKPMMYKEIVARERKAWAEQMRRQS